MAKQAVEATMMCPLTHELMNDPVILLSSGVSYERAALEHRFFVQGDLTDPISGAPTSGDYVSNPCMRSLIGAWRVMMMT